MHLQLPRHMSSGIGWKITGAGILATYWTLLFLSALISHLENEDFESDDTSPISVDEVDEPGITDLILSTFFIHAAGFSFILVGFVLEQGHIEKNDEKLEYIWESVGVVKDLVMELVPEDTEDNQLHPPIED